MSEIEELRVEAAALRILVQRLIAGGDLPHPARIEYLKSTVDDGELPAGAASERMRALLLGRVQSIVADLRQLAP